MKALWFAPALALVLSAPASAEPAERSAPVTASVSGASASLPDAYGVFVPRPTKRTKFDYSAWDEALEDMVLDMGPSLRRRAGRVRTRLSSRLIRGHDSPYRMEGSRFTFAYVSDEFAEGLTDYREELQELGTRYDIASLSRDEQLAYWINLHNVALIEKVSEAYPVREPSRIRLKMDGEKVALDDAKFIEIKGVPLSLSDIRTKIVYPNWRDQPEVIYGFFRGDIGGPRLSKYAFSSSYVDGLLDGNAAEFINSLRGFNAGRSTRNVSEIYREAAPFYFPNLDTDLTAHLVKYATDETKADLAKPLPYKFESYERTVADLSGGNGRGADAYGDARLSFEATEFLREAEDKYELLISKGLIRRPGTATGTVTIEDIEDEDLRPDPQYAPLAESVPEEGD